MDQTSLEQRVWTALHQVIDPELGINIVDLGLVYEVNVFEDNRVQIIMTMTTPACPLSGYIKGAAEEAVRHVLPEGGAVSAHVVWSPPWSPALISPGGLEQLNSR